MNSQKRIRTSLNGLTKLILFPDTYEELLDAVTILYNLQQGNIDSLYFTYFDDELDKVSVSNNYDLHQALIFTLKENIYILPVEINILPKSDQQEDLFNSIIFNKTTQTTQIQNEEPNQMNEFSFHKYTQFFKDLKSPHSFRSELGEKITSERVSYKIEILIKFAEKIYFRNNFTKFFQNIRQINKCKQNIFLNDKENPINHINYNNNKILNFDQNLYLDIFKNHLNMLFEKNIKRMKEKLIAKCTRDMKKYIKNVIQYQNEKIIHNAMCDECDLQVPIKGIRYKCSVCQNYNLCSSCEKVKGYFHEHPLIKIRKPEKYLEENIITLRSSIPQEDEINNIYKRRRLFDELKSLFKL
jgi:hypothetical protein